MSAALTAELVQAIDDFEADDQIAVIVLTGAGERAFSAGGEGAAIARKVAAGRLTVAEAMTVT